MADLVSDGKIRVIWAPACANLAAPTVAEANAGLRLDTVMTPAGLKVAPTTGSVDTSALSSTFTTNAAGRRTFANSVEIKRQDSADTALSTLVYRAAGFLFIWGDVRHRAFFLFSQIFISVITVYSPHTRGS